MPDPAGTSFYLAYLTVFAAAALGCLLGIWRARRAGLPDVRRGLVGLLLTSGLWALLHVGVLLAPTLAAKTVLYEAGLIVGFGTVWAWLWLCSAYSGRSLHRQTAVRWGIVAVFAVVTLTKLTNPWHSLYFTAELGTAPFPYLRVDHNVLYWLTAALSYALAAVGFFMLVEPLRRTVVGAGRLAGLFGLTALPLAANAVGYVSPWLLELSHEPVGVAAFALGALFLQRDEFENASRAGRREDPTLVLSEDGRVQNYNPQAAELFPVLNGSDAVGVALEEILPQWAQARDGPDGSEPEVLRIDEARTGNGGFDRYVRPTESSFQQGAGRLLVLSDVTDRERQRRTRKARLEGLSASIPGVLFEFRAGPGGERSVAFIGEEAEALLGLSTELDRFRERFFNRIPASYRSEFLQSVEDSIKNQRRWRQEIPFDRPDGERIWLLGSAEPEVEDEQVVFRGTLLEITGRKRAERDLKEERDRLETLLERLPTPVVRCRAGGEAVTVADANPAFRDTFGLSDEEVAGEAINDLVVPEAGQAEAAGIARQALDGGPVVREVQRVAAGEPRDFQLQVAGRQREAGDPEIYVIYTDITEQKERERRLRQAETLFQNAHDALFLIDVGDGDAFTMQRVNPAYEAATGLSGEALRGHPPRDIFGEEAGQHMEAKCQECVRRREPVEYEAEIHMEGTGTYWITRIAPVVVDGETQQIVGTTRNVTTKRRRKETLERQNDLFERAQEIADVGAWEYDVQSGEGTWTEKTYQILGCPPDAEPTPENTFELYHPEDRPQVREALRRAIEDGKASELEARVVSSDQTKWVRVRGEPYWEGEDCDGKASRVRGTIHDITDRKQREKALRERQKKIDALYEATGKLLQAESRTSVSARIHEVLQEVFAYPLRHTGFVDDGMIIPERTDTSGDHTLPEPEPRPVSGNTVAAQALQSGEAVVTERTSELENPIEYNDLRSAAAVPIGEWGALVVGKAQEGGFDQLDLHLLEVLGGYAALVLDRLRREASLREAKEEAEQASEMKSVLLANMSHEFRTPLTSIIGFAEAIGTEAGNLELPAGSPVDTHAALIEKSGKRLLDTLEGLLNLSQLEAGQMDLSAEPIDLATEVQRVTEEFRSEAQKEGIDLHVQTEATQATASTDGVRIVVENLLSNAIKYTGEGGSVRVRTYRADGRAVLEVEDTGIGMEPDQTQGLFDPFRQASEGWNRKYEGTGIGLAVTKKTIDQVGGAIEVETEKGEGSRFVVRLPGCENGKAGRKTG